MSPSAKPPELIVGVGASAGGLDAFKALLHVLPPDTGMAFILVQHLDPSHESLLGELLEPRTKMPVRQAAQDVKLERDTIYVIRPDTALAVRDGRIELTPPTLERGVRLPVDHLFHSLARECGPACVAIVLSGAGSDGSSGVRAVKAAGGLTIVQSPDSCGQPGMPSNSLATGVIDLVLDIADIPAALARFQRLPPTRPEPQPQEQESKPSTRQTPTFHLEEGELSRLAAVLEAHTNFDLRVYKSGTIERRVHRRMTLSGHEELEDYFELLRSQSEEQHRLVRDLLISVTQFFRDTSAIATLREQVIDPLVRESGQSDTLRVWVPGCATGEEAYTLGMEFLDSIQQHGKQLGLQIFATDIDKAALEVARTARYPLTIAEHVPKDKLEAYFEPLDGRGYKVRPRLRDTVSFALHDLTKNPPFSRMHLVSCRNVLIYLRTPAQKYVLKVLHFALETGSHLFLGTSESTGLMRDLFTTISKSERIYQKSGVSKPITLSNSKVSSLAPGPSSEGRSGLRAMRLDASGQTGDLARRAVVAAFAPPSLVVSGDGKVLFNHGKLEPFLHVPQGENPRFDVSSIVRPAFITRVRGALYKCRRDKAPTSALTSPDSSSTRYRIDAQPTSLLGDDVVILSFHQVDENTHASAPQKAAPVASADEAAVVEQLERELQATREDLRNTVEELETSNEELRSSNEESMSMNEELQSANEELEATTEELRSLNEELTTVNVQLREKVEQLEEANDDLSNFFSSTKIATIFLDETLCIKRFTPASRKLLNVDYGDLGRRVGDIARELLQHDLMHEASAVLEQLSSRSREIQTAEGVWIARDIHPYRTGNRRIEGVVVTFTDITSLKRATEGLEQRACQQQLISRMGLKALRATAIDEFLNEATRDISETLNVDLCKVLELQPLEDTLLLRAGCGWDRGLVGSAFVSAGTESQAGYTLESTAPIFVEDLDSETRFSGPELLHRHRVVSGLSCTIRDNDRPYGVIGIHTKTHRTFTEADASCLQAAASVIGSAIARHQRRRRLHLEAKVNHVLAEARAPEAALATLIEEMMPELEANYAELCWPTPEGNAVQCDQHFVTPFGSGRPQRFKHPASEPGRTYSPDDLSGMVLSQKSSNWCTNLGSPEVFATRDAHGDLQIVSGVALPILDGGEVRGVLTFFSPNRVFADEAFLLSLDSIGRSVGDFLARAEFEEQARRLAAFTQSSHDAIFSFSPNGTIQAWLAGAETLLGYNRDERLQCLVDDLIPEGDREQHHQRWLKLFEGKVVPPFEGTLVRKDGSEVEVSQRLAAIRNHEDEVVEISATVRDISRLKDTENRLLAADRQKDEFIAMLSHELRNPLSAVRSATEVLRLIGGDDLRLHRAQAVLDRQTSHMGRLLDGLLDMSRIIRGKIHLKLEPIELTQLCRDVISDSLERIRKGGLQLQTELSELSVVVEGDRVRLAQIIDNLLSNAIKYTPEGGAISVLCGVENEGNSQWGIVVVRDTGVGISDELLPKMFEVFRQSEQTLDRSQGGLGIGLALVKSLVEMHGGTIDAHSEGDGSGAEFVVRLPLSRKRDGMPTEGTSAADTAGVLLIEDSHDTAEMMKLVLELAGHTVQIATSGSQGVSMAREHPPEVILCDIGLPGGMSGYDVATTLRSEDTTRHIPLIALSGYARPQDQAQSAQAGFDAHIPKPADLQTIQRVFGEVLRQEKYRRLGHSA